jgi:hypothetical protein
MPTSSDEEPMVIAEAGQPKSCGMQRFPPRGAVRGDRAGSIAPGLLFALGLALGRIIEDDLANSSDAYRNVLAASNATVACAGIDTQ